MATHKSAIKRHRQSVKRAERNRSIRTGVKTAAKKALASIETKDPAAIDKVLRESIKTIDKAASKGVLHRRTASRKISRLSKRAAAAQRS